MKIKKLLVITSLFLTSLFAEVGVVDTNVLLIKKEPSENSVKFGYYKMNQVVNILGEHEGIDNEDRWFKTKKGYVKAKYVILEKYLPQFIDISEVDFDKNALQLIVYQSTVVESLRQLRKNLKNEKNLYLQKSKNVFVIYLVNFDSYKDALAKKNELSNLYPSSFITKVKSKSSSKKENIIPSKTKKEKIIKTIERVELDESLPSLAIADLESEEISFEEIDALKDIENKESVIIDEPIIENIPMDIKKTPQRSNRNNFNEPKSIKIEKPKVIKSIPKVVKKEIPKEVKKVEVIKPSYNSLMESLLLKLNE